MLELKDITRIYRGQPAARDVTLTAPAGGRTVIVGPSGSGKTTLLRLIAGFEAPDRGEITLGGRVLASPSVFVPPHLRRVAYVPQEGALFPHMSVAANIGFAIPRQAADRHARIAELLEKVGLSAVMGERRPHQLSGGQQQRVALARALAQEPELMLLDEPFSALDTSLRDAMRDMVESLLAERGITAVLVTHDQAEAMAFADHLIVMRNGKVADAGSPQRLYERPADMETAAFLGDAIVLPADIVDKVAMTALGPVVVDHAGPALGTVLIRPDQISLSPAPAAGSDENRRPLVRHRTYCGGHWRVEIEFIDRGAPEIASIFCAGPRTFSIRVDNALDIKPGEHVDVKLAGPAHVLRRQALDTQLVPSPGRP
nr:ABC transporter ATP-binding protein [Devosia salina]